MGRSTVADRLSSFFGKVLPLQKLGDVWQGTAASSAYDAGNLNSQPNGTPFRIAFRNLSPVPLLLCWVAENGDLHHFYSLPPASSVQGALKEVVTSEDHIEHTSGGHAFCVAYLPEEDMLEAQQQKSLQGKTACIIGGYRAFQKTVRDSIHVVTISKFDPFRDCCFPAGNYLRGKSGPFFDEEDVKDSAFHWNVKVCRGSFDPTPFDTSKKVYELKKVGGWSVYFEPGWNQNDAELEKILEEDLEEAAKILPAHAVEYLCENCPIWVNASIKFGPQACPIRGKGCCFHPSKGWLTENGMNEAKHRCIEMYDAIHYKDNLKYWGRAGVLIHELSHAYHNHMLPDGYDNKEIRQCYKKAMKDGLYDCVAVKGSKRKTKAYASSNEMEYFAELSAAFLGGFVGDEEYNKWFPFNRKQVQEHDPRAYNLLCRLWKVDSQQ